ncbi:MAG: YfiR family protein [Bacteroidota bacterium]|nr:YfiR family protein [Bacteroidota bacterium]
MKCFIFSILLYGASTSIIEAQDMPVPVEVQYPLFLKIFTFDRNFHSRADEGIAIGILYQSEYRKSLNVRNAFIDIINNFPLRDVDGAPIRYVSIDITRESDLRAAVKREGIDLFYIAPLRAVDISTITGISREQHVLTLTGVPEYVIDGVSVSIDVKGDKPLIVINLPAAKAEGVDFDAQLLKLAKVIR